MATDPILRIRHSFTGIAGLPGVTTTYAQGELGDASTICDAWLAFYDDIKAGLAAALTVTLGGVIDRVDPVTGNTIESGSVTPDSVTGTSTNERCPPTTQMLCELLTGVYVSGRQVRGKMFLPGMTGDSSANGVPDSTFKATVETALNDVNDTGGMNGAWVVWSRANARTEFVTDTFVWSQFAVLRSRRD